MSIGNPQIFDIRQHEIVTLKRIDELLISGKYKAVIKEASAARFKYPNNFFFYTMESIAHSMTDGTEKALTLLETAKKKFPDAYEVHFQLAKVYEDIEDYNKAEESYKKSYEVTPTKYANARSDCLNDLGALYWKLHRRKEALENWKLAILEYPQNKKAKNNLRHFTNEYDEPRSISPLMDDIHHFQNIQIAKYFAGQNKNEFQSMEEANRVLQLIGDEWNKKIASEKEKLDLITTEEKTKWFESTEIDFDEKPKMQPRKSKLSKSLKTKTGGSVSKKKKKKLSKEEKELEEFKRKFPFLPEDGLLHITIAAPFLITAGVEIERFEEILKEGTEEEEEQELLLWANDIGINLFLSVLAENDEEAEDMLNEALDIAAEFLDEDEIEDAFEVTMKAIQEFGGNVE